MNGTALVRSELKDEQIDLIKRTVANGATDNELKLFLYQCERTGLDPLAKQIYSIKRAGKMVTQIGIDGARLVAQRTGRYAGQDGPYWCGDDGVWKDVWLSEKHPQAAKVNVFLMDVDRGTPGVAHWKEYAPANSDMWRKMPALMLAKCAEMLALRKAFPQELSGLYTAEEMSQADSVVDTTYTVAEHAPRLSTSPENDVSFEATKQTPPHQRMWGQGLKVFGTDWDMARPWLIKQWTKHVSPDNIRESSSDLNDDEKDLLADYLTENMTSLSNTWPKQKALMLKSQQKVAA
jgi:phage recombination protein Bet